MARDCSSWKIKQATAVGE